MSWYFCQVQSGHQTGVVAQGCSQSLISCWQPTHQCDSVWDEWQGSELKLCPLVYLIEIIRSGSLWERSCFSEKSQWHPVEVCRQDNTKMAHKRPLQVIWRRCQQPRTKRCYTLPPSSKLPRHSQRQLYALGKLSNFMNSILPCSPPRPRSVFVSIKPQ